MLDHLIIKLNWKTIIQIMKYIHSCCISKILLCVSYVLSGIFVMLANKLVHQAWPKILLFDSFSRNVGIWGIYRKSLIEVQKLIFLVNVKRVSAYNGRKAVVSSIRKVHQNHIKLLPRLNAHCSWFKILGKYERYKNRLSAVFSDI